MKNNGGSEIYIHVPFCARKCNYCDFVSMSAGASVQDAYFDALIKEIELKAESVGLLPIDSIFIGGGTPSLVEPKNILRVMETLNKRFVVSNDAEITIEMNPNSASFEKIKAYKDAGINRVSIGLQSTDDKELKLLGRLHNYEGFLRSFDDVRNAGFENVNVDLMSAIPMQTIDSYVKSLERVVALKPEHISAYSLIIEEGTPFYERYSSGEGLPSEDDEREMYYLTKAILRDAGFMRYEISNYARAGYECRHNVGYWRLVPYLGFGIAASSLWDGIRYDHHKDIHRYIAGDFSEEETKLSLQDVMEEFMFLGLRMVEGIDVDEFRERFGKSIQDEYGTVLCKLTQQGLIDVSSRVKLTDKGMDVANYCMSEFIH